MDGAGKADVDANKRKIIWQDGKRLSITQSVKRIHADFPDFPFELIEVHLIGWLEMEFAPPTYSQLQLDECVRPHRRVGRRSPAAS